MAEDLQITPWLCVPAQELRWQAVRSGGPGGQNVNKVATKVELRFRVSPSSLPDAVRARLAERARTRIAADGDLVIVCDETRSQTQNLQRARAKLAELIRSALQPPRPRRATRPTRASVARRLNEKARRKEKKAARQPPRE